jgi:light-harvesting complex 1 beta chain
MASNDKPASATGLTEAEAQEVHGWVVRSFTVYVVFAIVAHVLMWMWRPWLGPAAETSMSDHGTNTTDVASV